MPSIGGIPDGVQIMNSKEDAMSKTVKTPPESDVFYEVIDALEQQKREINWILEHAKEDGDTPFEARHKQIISGAIMHTLKDQADEFLFLFCFGSTKAGLESANNLITRMHRFQEVIS